MATVRTKIANLEDNFDIRDFEESPLAWRLIRFSGQYHGWGFLYEVNHLVRAKADSGATVAEALKDMWAIVQDTLAEARGEWRREGRDYYSWNEYKCKAVHDAFWTQWEVQS